MCHLFYYYYSLQAIDITPTKDQKPRKSSAKQQRHAESELASGPAQQRKKETSPSSPARSSRHKVLYPPLKLKQRRNLSTLPLPGQLLPPISASADREEAEVKRENKTLLAPDSTTGSVRQLKSRHPIPKLDPSCLPQHQVLLQHMVSDNMAPTKCRKSSGKLSQSAKQEAGSKPQTDTTASSSELSGLPLKRDEAQLGLSNLPSSRYEGSRERMPSSGPLRLDKMKLAEGVSLLDPPADDKMYLRSDLPGLSTDLKPIQSGAAVPLYSLGQVIAGPPQVTPSVPPQN